MTVEHMMIKAKHEAPAQFIRNEGKHWLDYMDSRGTTSQYVPKKEEEDKEKMSS